MNFYAIRESPGRNEVRVVSPEVYYIGSQILLLRIHRVLTSRVSEPTARVADRLRAGLFRTAVAAVP